MMFPEHVPNATILMTLLKNTHLASYIARIPEIWMEKDISKPESFELAVQFSEEADQKEYSKRGIQFRNLAAGKIRAYCDLIINLQQKYMGTDRADFKSKKFTAKHTTKQVK